VKKKKKRHRTGSLHEPGGRRGGLDGEEAAARLAPLEEREEFRKSPQSDGNQSNINDTIRVDKNSVKMPEHLVDEERDAASTFRVDYVVVVILAVMLAFIAFITWQISRMPDQ
jgi:hypothetical protein